MSKKKKWNIKGETLAETIIALSILAIGITVASTVIMNSIRNLTNAKNRVVAINLAREGIEAMRSIRDTNWLLYSDRRRQCWNHHPSITSGCDGTTPILPGVYIVYKHSDQSWRIQQSNVPASVDSSNIANNENDPDITSLSLVDIDLATDSNDDGNPTNDLDFYNHIDPDNIPAPGPLGTEVRGTLFMRYIVIEYLENTPTNSPPSDLVEPNDSINHPDEWNAISQDSLNRMRITSVVGWQAGEILQTAELKTIITDHLGREDLIQ